MRADRQQYSETEADTIRAAADGDRTAMRSVYEAHIGYLTAVCSRYIIDDEDVRDVLQESFLKIFAALGKFRYRGKGSLRAWMTRIVVNDALKYIREKGRNSVLEFQEHIPDTADEDGEADIRDIPPETLQRMIRSLPDPHRAVFSLYVFQEMSHKEISAALGMASGTSASCLHRARKMLVKMINEYKHERDV